MSKEKVRVGIYLSKEVYKQAQHKAIDEEISVSQVIENLLKQWAK